MNNYFSVKLNYVKQLESGAFKRVTEPYLFASMSFTDAESRTYEELGDLIRGEFKIKNIDPKEYEDIFHYEDADVWYECKIQYQDGEGGKKIIKRDFLLSANSTKEANARLLESLQGMMVDFKITSVKETAIVDIFPYNEELDKEISRKPLSEINSLDDVFVGSIPVSDFDSEEVED